MALQVAQRAHPQEAPQGLRELRAAQTLPLEHAAPAQRAARTLNATPALRVVVVQTPPMLVVRQAVQPAQEAAPNPRPR